MGPKSPNPVLKMINYPGETVIATNYAKPNLEDAAIVKGIFDIVGKR